jgi:hypothetical protein
MKAAEVAPGQRPRSKFSPDRDALSCAGQSCSERDKCLKYKRHAAWIGQRWASFDIERQAHGDTCQALEPIHNQERSKHALQKRT